MTKPDHSEVAVFRGIAGRSPRERYLPDGHVGMCQYRCAWEDRYALIAEIAAGGGELFPHNPASGARAYAAYIEGVGRSDGTATLIDYPYALITVFYSTRIYEFKQGKFVTESIEPFEESTRLPWFPLRWGGPSGPQVEPNEAPIMEVGGFVYVITFHHMLGLHGGVQALLRCCNANPWVPYTLGVTFAPETLLYKTPAVKRTIQLGALRDWQVTYRLYFRGASWNKRWSAKLASWQYVYHKDGHQIIFYPLADFDAFLS